MELNGLILQAGFDSVNFHSPLPDYKLTTSVILEEGFDHPLFDSAALIRDSFSSDPQLPTTLSFVPELVVESLQTNRLELDLANSFLIVANRGKNKLTDVGSLAYHYSTSRKKEFCKCIRFQSSDQEIEVEMIKMGTSNEIGPLKHLNLSKSKYRTGKILKDSIFEILSQDYWSHEDLQKIYFVYLTFLKSFVSLQESHDEVIMLPGKYIDLIPRNIYVSGNGELNLFDQEWEASGLVDIRQVIFRSVLSLSNISILGTDELGVAHTLESLTNLVFALLDVEINPEEIDLFLRTEISYQNLVSGRHLTYSDMRQGFESKIGRNRFRPNSSLVDSAERDSAVAERDSAVAERDSVLNSTIWKITKPYRKLRSLF